MLINLRNGLMAGKRLPYDAEVEYLESTGTQWIDTGVSISFGDVIEVSIGIQSSTKEGGIYGSGSNPSSNDRYQIYNYSPTLFRTMTVRSDGINVILPQQASFGIRREVVFDLKNKITYVDSSIIAQNYTTSPSARSAYLFARHCRDTGIDDADISAARVWILKHYKNGVLVRDFIPVRKGTVGYLYDRVSGKLFGNAGTGDFVLGPDVVPVEWISSDGNQYIDTGYVFQFGDDVSATFQPLATPTQTTYFLGADTAYNAGFNVHYDPSNSSTGLRYCYGGGFAGYNTGIAISPVQDFSTSTIYACNGNANKRTINSGKNTASVQDSGLNSASVILFCGRRNANVRPASTGWAVASRFFGFGATRNGAGVRAMKPVRVGTDATSWEGAMMDVLTRRIYRNAGTGAFTYGNDLKYPIPAE